MLTAISRLWAWIGSIVRRRHFVSSVATVGYVPPPVPPVVLGALTFSATSFTVGGATSGTIIGATALSTVTASGLPSGLTINGALRTWTWSGTGTASTGTFTLTETLAGASNTPRASVISYTINAASGSLTISTAPQIVGDPVVGQRVYFINGTYSATPDSITPTVTVGGVAVEHDTDSLLILDMYAGSAIGYSEVAHKSGYTDSSTNAATSTANVAAIDLTNAITAFTRTSTSGDNSSATGLTFSVTFAANVYEGYYLDAKVYSDGTLTTRTQHVTHRLTHDDLQAGATINLLPDGLTKLGPNDWLQLGVFTTSPNGLGYVFTYVTAISPTDAVVPMAWNTGDAAVGITVASGGVDATASSGSYGMIRSNRSKSSGKWYAEYKILNTGSLVQVGWANATASLNNQGGSDTNSVVFFNNGNFFYNGYVGGPGVSWATNDIIQCCIDKGTDTVWFGRNNTFTGSPSAGTGGISVPGIGTVFAAFDAKAGEVLAQWLSASQTYTPPTGFTAIG
jgi:hypothetical protein